MWVSRPILLPTSYRSQVMKVRQFGGVGPPTPILQLSQLGNPHHLQDVVALCVTEVSNSNLSAHVPTIEGAGWEFEATHLQ